MKTKNSINSALNSNQSLSNRFECRIKFNVCVQNNNLLTYQDKLTKRQITIHKLISYLKYEKGMSWRRISSWLNRSGIKTHRGNTWTETGSSVHSVIKRMRQREDRINNQRNKKHETTMTDVKIKKIGE